MSQAHWHGTLTKAQRRAVLDALDAHWWGRRADGGGSEWSVFMMPTTGPPLYIEIRRRDNRGRIIEQVPVWTNAEPWAGGRRRWLSEATRTTLRRGRSRGSIPRVA